MPNPNDSVSPAETPGGADCLRAARAAGTRDAGAAWAWLARLVDAPDDDFAAWQGGAALATTLRAGGPVPSSKRSARLAVLGTSTTAQLEGMLRLAAARFGVDLEIHAAPYGQVHQEILDPGSGTHRFAPDLVLVVLDEHAIDLPAFADDPDAAVAAEVARWASLRDGLARAGASARLVVLNVAVPPADVFGHLAARLPGSRRRMLRAFNDGLADALAETGAIVDAERLAAEVGAARWFDDRYWHRAKQAPGLGALPTLARHVAAVVAAELGLTRKCLVLDLDNTLWGGVIGEDGLDGIALGAGPAGEAFVAFQRAILELKRRGVILAVCSKNNDADAREPFERHPDMVLSLDDVAMFVANWDPKPANIARIAGALGIGIDSLVFVDDNPAEREAVRQALPDVDVIVLGEDPAGHVGALAGYLGFETARCTAEDRERSAQYRARAAAAELESQCGTLEEFHRSLGMQAQIAPFDALHVPRIVQLIGKTNQFNVTTRRHGREHVESCMADDRWETAYLRLRDRFADHGLVALALAEERDGCLDIDTFLMSCRVIGRTVEAALLARLCAAAQRRGCTSLRGTYVPTAKNGLVADLFERHGFDLETKSADGSSTWTYDIAARGPIVNDVIAPWAEEIRDAA